MSTFVALLRGVNVGGRTLKMTDLKHLATELGLAAPRTYIASGNLLFDSTKTERTLKRELEAALEDHFGKPIGAMIRTGAELAAVVAGNPFADQPGNRVAAIFLDDEPPLGAVETAVNVDDERLALGKREIYVHYPSGMGRSKLRIPAAKAGTARNMNTVAKLADLAMEKA